MSPDHVMGMAWPLWWVSWVVASPWRSRAVKRADWYREMPSRLLVAAGAALLIASYTGGLARRDLVVWQLGRTAAWACVPAGLSGFLLTWWARIHLGQLWSSGVTRKADHRIVDTGPYRFVRHPIYSGLILAAAATGVVRGTLLALGAAFLLALGFYAKARLEEHFLAAELGVAYDQYRRRVGMLVPVARHPAR